MQRRLAAGGLALALLCAAGEARGQSRQIPAPPQPRGALLVGATVHTVTGETFDPGWVAFEGGLIRAVGAGAEPVTSDADLYRADRLHVYPGLISTDTTLGLVETSSVAVTVDTTETGRLTPEVRAAVAVNPDSDLIPVARAAGILTALLMPRGGLVCGRASTIRLDGWTWEQMAIDAQAGLVVDWPAARARGRFPGAPAGAEGAARRSPEEDLAELERLFDDAAAYLRSRDADPAAPTDLRLEAMREILSGSRPVFVRASTRAQIESAVAWAGRRGLRIVIVGGDEADLAADLLREHDVPVVVTGLHRLPRHRDDPYDASFTLPVRLDRAGVRFAIASGASAAHERTLNHNAATAVAFGLSWQRALEAVTIDAARIVGLGATHGSIEVGKAATFIVTTGDPLEMTTQTLLAFVDGRRIDLESRHTALYRKYREKYRQLGLLDDAGGQETVHEVDEGR
jgi:imidazolonepropionase-like amidohydrolase